jgi:hypothetical protein
LTLDCFPKRASHVAYSCRGTNDQAFLKGRQTKFQASGEVAASAPTSLDSINISRHGQEWSQKEKRAFHRFLSGIKAAFYRNEIVRFMTLTGSPASSPLRLNRHFESLVKRIRRGYFLSDEERRKRKTIGQKVRFEYCKVKTNEGNWILHVVFRGEYIPQDWLSTTWEELHGAKIVYIEKLHGNSKRMAAYLATQYLSLQEATYTRMSYSFGWVCRGFVKRWHHLWEVLGERESVLVYWECLLRSKSLLVRTKQLKLSCS